jgi:glycosyltransferase involved in cell wall biosynthesis
MITSVVIASSGRPKILHQTVTSILAQTLPPSEIILSTIHQDDWEAGIRDSRIRHISGRRGIPAQLNSALDDLNPKSEIVFIFDDDVELAPDYCERAQRWFVEDPSLLAFDGNHLQDGNIDHEQSVVLLASRKDDRPHEFIDHASIYGCNICARKGIFKLERFDENLRGYAWLFDYDWIRRVAQHGRTGHVADCHFVHLMTPSGRTSGLNHGYMQIFHPYYIWRKGLMGNRELLQKYIIRYFSINLIKSVIGDANIDRPGRLRGNLRALHDILVGTRLPHLPSDRISKTNSREPLKR